MTISNENFTIKNVEVNGASPDQDHVCFNIQTEKGEVRVLEWLNDNKVERTDSHLKIHENIKYLFSSYIPYAEIFDAVDEELEKLGR